MEKAKKCLVTIDFTIHRILDIWEADSYMELAFGRSQYDKRENGRWNFNAHNQDVIWEKAYELLSNNLHAHNPASLHHSCNKLLQRFLL